MAIDQVTQDQASGVMGPSDSIIVTKTNEIIAQVNANEAAIGTLTGPLLFKGSVAVPGDFPDPGDVQNGWTYTATADVTDNDPTKTNTGQEFQAGDELAWNGVDWTKLGATGAIHEMGATPYVVTDDVTTVLVDTVGIGGPSVVELPSAAGRTGKLIRVVDKTGGASGANVAVTPQGGESIDGFGVFNLVRDGQDVLLVSDGTNWTTEASARVLAANAAHAAGDGSDHSNVALNDGHRTGDGTDHSAVATLVAEVKPPTPVNFGMSPYPITPADVVLLVDTSGGAVNVNLPNPAANIGKVYYVKDAVGNAGVAAVNIDPGLGIAIDGALGVTAIVVAWDKLTVMSDGVGWVTL